MSKLDDLKPTPRRSSKLGLTEEDGYAAIRAIRRGIPATDVARALEQRTVSAIYGLLGTWAIHYASVPEKTKAEEEPSR